MLPGVFAQPFTGRDWGHSVSFILSFSIAFLQTDNCTIRERPCSSEIRSHFHQDADGLRASPGPGDLGVKERDDSSLQRIQEKSIGINM